MKDKALLGNIMFSCLGAAAVTAYLSYVMGADNSVYYYGFVLVPVFLVLAYRLKLLRDAARLLEEVKEQWGKTVKKKRNLGVIRRYFDVLCDDKEGPYIDDQTWDDLNMDEIYTILDRNLTTAGEQVLYDILRSPLIKKEPLLLRNTLIKQFQINKELREKIQVALQGAGRLKEGDILDVLFGEHKKNDFMKIVCYAAAAAPIVIIALIPFITSIAFVLFALSLALNVYIHANHGKKNDISINSIGYLAHLIKAAGTISKIENHELRPFLEELKVISEKCKGIAKGTTRLGVPEGVDVLYDYIKIELLIEERSYYRVIGDIQKYREELLRMYRILGEIDSYISAASYRQEIKKYTEPEFVAEKRIVDIKGLIHPLIEEAVPNDISIGDGGIIITGSNMSGKSTFLRSAGVAAIMAQTLYMVKADEYKASFFNIMTSISPGDNIMGGKSYYLGEAEAILRILKGCSETLPTLCIVDEIFRGTNPVERVSASVEILEYLLGHNAVVLVATHDLELPEILKGKYECYYFTEDVDEKEGLEFDYRMRKGISPTRNAIKVLNYLGYPKEIVDGAEKRSLKHDA
ncbi:MAG: MutS family DNA mismatch repair protein [Bacillota bacterium]|nr:MutS family DNA mismatch repair protein [Bacillota bacterium]